MEQLRQWILTVSLACITCGVLQQFVGSKKQISGIKLVLTLYILVTALSPMSGASLDWQIPELHTSPAAASLDTGQEILALSEQALRSQIEEALVSKGLHAEVEIMLERLDTGEVKIGSLTVKTAENHEEVRACIQAVLDTDVDLTWIS